MQQLDVYYQLLSQHVSGIIMPIFRRTKALLLHSVYCSVTSGNIYIFPLVTVQCTKCSNRVFVLLKMGMMMPETC